MKIATENLNEIMKKCTGKEIDLLMYIGQFQDETGLIRGIYYKDVLENTNIKKSTFYKLLTSLEEKEIIRINYLNKDFSFWEVLILNNEFSKQEDYKKGYINLNYEVLHSDLFKAMTRSEKILVIKLITLNFNRKEKIKITYKRMADWTNRSVRSVKKFVCTLSKVFNIVIKEGLCLIDCIKGFSMRREKETNKPLIEAEGLSTHLIKYRLQVAGCEATKKDLKDTCILFKQYAKIGTENLLKVIDNALNNIGILAPRYVNKLINISFKI